MSSINLINDEPMVIVFDLGTCNQSAIICVAEHLTEVEGADFTFSFAPLSRRMSTYGKQKKDDPSIRTKPFSVETLTVLLEEFILGNVDTLLLSDDNGNSISFDLNHQVSVQVSSNNKIQFVQSLTGLEDVYEVCNLEGESGYTLLKTEGLSEESKNRLWDYITPSVRELISSTDATEGIFSYPICEDQAIESFHQKFMIYSDDEIVVTQYFDPSENNPLLDHADFTYSFTYDTNGLHPEMPDETLMGFFTKDINFINQLFQNCLKGKTASVRVINATTGTIGSFDDEGYWIFHRNTLHKDNDA